jgi:hypothetical protein
MDEIIRQYLKTAEDDEGINSRILEIQGVLDYERQLIKENELKKIEHQKIEDERIMKEK